MRLNGHEVVDKSLDPAEEAKSIQRGVAVAGEDAVAVIERSAVMDGVTALRYDEASVLEDACPWRGADHMRLAMCLLGGHDEEQKRGVEGCERCRYCKKQENSHLWNYGLREAIQIVCSVSCRDGPREDVVSLESGNLNFHDDDDY